MKEIKAILRPNRLPLLREKLRATPGFPGMTVSKAEGCSAPSVHGSATVKDELTDYSPKIMVTVIADDEMVPIIRQAIIDASSTGQIGDGIVWTLDLSSLHRIRNGESML